MAPLPPFDPAVVEAIASVLGETSTGLSGSQIGRLLDEAGIADPGSITKRDRIQLPLLERQERDGACNVVAHFVTLAMRPVRYRADPGRFAAYREELNVALAFAGLAVSEEGRLERVRVAATLSEAEDRANRLRAELRRRAVHPDVLRFCIAELLVADYFHAVFEAAKSLADKLRDRTGLRGDGTALVHEALAPDRRVPYLAWNTLSSESDRSEHRGITELMHGLFAYFRNVPAHVPRIHRQVSEQEALDLLTLVSFLHRKLDEAVPTGRRPENWGLLYATRILRR